MRSSSNYDTKIEYVKWLSSGSQSSASVPLRCHSDQSTATQSKMWVNFTNGEPLFQLFATLPLECHWIFFSATQLLPYFGRCHSYYQGTTTLPIHCQSSATRLPLCCHSVKILPLNQSSATGLSLFWHSVNTMSSGRQELVKWQSSGY